MLLLQLLAMRQVIRIPQAPQVDGDVDQSAGMLSEDVKAKGYALLCVSYPQGDCTIQTIEEVCIMPLPRACGRKAPDELPAVHDVTDEHWKGAVAGVSRWYSSFIRSATVRASTLHADVLACRSVDVHT